MPDMTQYDDPDMLLLPSLSDINEFLFKSFCIAQSKKNQDCNF